MNAVRRSERRYSHPEALDIEGISGFDSVDASSPPRGTISTSQGATCNS
jgi:hypothetical protein